MIDKHIEKKGDSHSGILVFNIFESIFLHNGMKLKE